MKVLSKTHRKWRAKQPHWVRRKLAHRDFVEEKMNSWFGRMELRLLFLLAIVLVKRVQVANLLYAKSDSALATAAQTYVDLINGNAYFSTPPSLSAISTAIADFIAAISAAANRDKEKVDYKNSKRLVLMNLCAALSNYVEDVANDPVNATDGAATVIESAGMRPRPFTSRGKQIWDVRRGEFIGQIFMTAAAIKSGTHEWQYTTTPDVESSWIMATPTRKAHTTLSGLASGSFVYCRHRSVGNVVSDWEGHDPVVVG